MNGEELRNILQEKNDYKLTEEDIRELIKEYPYFEIPVLLYLKQYGYPIIHNGCNGPLYIRETGKRSTDLFVKRATVMIRYIRKKIYRK